MNIILDTNIFIQNFLINSKSFNLLIDYLNKTNSRLLMPLIVYQEIAEIYKTKLCERLEAYERAGKSLEKTLLDTELFSLIVDIPNEVDKYLEFVKKRLMISDKSIIPFREHYLNELVNRAITRRKPFSEKGEEFRDALLWLTVLDVAEETDQETLAFISNDTKAFGHNDQLHEALVHEADATGRQINFYNSIMKFIESHATQVEYITPSWLFNVINFEAYSDVVTEKLRGYLESLEEFDLRQKGWKGLEFTGYLSTTATATDENLTEYYVYEKADGSLYVQANFYIEYEVEFISTERVRVRQGEYFTYSLEEYEQDYDNEYKMESKIVYKYPEAEIVFGVIVREKQVIDVELSSWYL